MSNQPSTFFQWVDRFNIRLGAVSGVLILVLVVVVTVDSLSRKLFAVTVPGATEFNTLLLVIVIYLGLAGAQARYAHFTVQAFVEMLPPPIGRYLGALTTLLSLGFCGILAWLTCMQALSSIENGEIGYGIIAFPIWPSRAAIAIGFILLSVQLLVQLVRILAREKTA